MKSKSIVCVFLTFTGICSAQVAVAQEDAVSKDRNFRLEVEPASFVLRGAAGSISYNLTEDNNFSLGVYCASLDVPVWARPGMFLNVGADTSTVRLGFEAALIARYRFQIFPEWESNPYVGLIAGWEYFDITQPSAAGTVRLSTFVATPYIGYEFYFFNQMLYLNPQLRSVLYFGASSSDDSRPEKMGQFLLLPQIALGIRF